MFIERIKKIVYFMEVSCLQIRIILLFPLFCFIIQKIMLNLIAIQLLIIWSIVNHKFYVEIQNVSNIHIITFIQIIAQLVNIKYISCRFQLFVQHFIFMNTIHLLF